MNTAFLSDRTYRFLFLLLLAAYLPGLFVPLMDNDSAHHASIALRMNITGNYAFLVDQNGDYLDKPHLLFWLAAFSFKVFGVNAFAYKLPTFLFTILGTYSTYRLGKVLYNAATGKLAALLVASAFAYILANSDVRMDAILTACIAFASWQLAEFVRYKTALNAVGSALGLALGFCTKGHIAVFVPAVFIFFFILYRKEWRIFINWKWLLMLVCFGLFISPVVYSYYLQYNLHPEKTIRGQDHINGIKFILFNQSIERFSGGMGADAKNDYFFFLHSFLWAFAPWSVITYVAVVNRIGKFSRRKEEWGTTAAFLAVLIIVSLSSFKLPHYLNIIFPAAAVLTAAFIYNQKDSERASRRLYTLQIILSIILLIVAGIVNVWAFPVTAVWVIVASILLLAAVFYFMRTEMYSHAQKAVLVPVATVIFVFFLLNSSFYPKLLTYQGGKNMARITKGKVDPANVYVQANPYSYSPSYTFYSESKFQTFDDSLLAQGKKVWLQAEQSQLQQLEQSYQLGEIFEVPHFRVTRLNFKFLNPATRDKEVSRMLLVEIKAKK